MVWSRDQPASGLGHGLRIQTHRRGPASAGQETGQEQRAPGPFLSLGPGGLTWEAGELGHQGCDRGTQGFPRAPDPECHRSKHSNTSELGGARLLGQGQLLRGKASRVGRDQGAKEKPAGESANGPRMGKERLATQQVWQSRQQGLQQRPPAH